MKKYQITMFFVTLIRFCIFCSLHDAETQDINNQAVTSDGSAKTVLENLKKIKFAGGSF